LFKEIVVVSESYTKKVKIEVNFVLEQAMKAERGSIDIAVLFP
jgi:hypothetical protein